MLVFIANIAHGRADNTAWVLTSVSCRVENNHRARRWRKGWMGNYSHNSVPSMLNGWSFTSVKFHSILSGFLLFFPNGLLTERPANGCCLRNLAADYRSCSLMRATCCYNSMKFETCCLMMSWDWNVFYSRDKWRPVTLSVMIHSQQHCHD